MTPFLKIVFLPVVAAILIDGISEALKKLGTFFVSEISDSVMLHKMSWDGVFAWIVASVIMIGLLYFVIKGLAKYESDNLVLRTAILAGTLILIGSSNLWDVIFQRPEMRKMYDAITPDQSTVQDVDRISFASWNRSVYCHNDESYGLCAGDCSVAFIYSVPKIFGEGTIKLDFGANKKLLRKSWY
jgi:hypothetical protein